MNHIPSLNSLICWVIKIMWLVTINKFWDVGRNFQGFGTIRLSHPWLLIIFQTKFLMNWFTDVSVKKLETFWKICQNKFHKWRESKKFENKIVPPKVFNQSFTMRRNLAPSQRKVGTGFVAPSFLGNIAIPKVTTTSTSMPMPFVSKAVASTNHQQMTSSDSG